MSQFNVRNLSVLTYANGFTQWFYKADAPSDVRTPGFFNCADELIAVGDHIHVSSPAGGLILAVVTPDAVGTVRVVEMCSSVMPHEQPALVECGA